MAEWELVLRYVQILFSWPVIYLVLGLVAIRYFHEPLSDFLRRIVKGEAYGVRVEAATPSEQRKELQEVRKVQSNDTIDEYIRNNPKEVIREYLRMANGYRFEKTFNLIYGTQLDLLEYLSTKGTDGDSYTNLLSFYNEFVKRSGLASTQYADYLGFLKDSLFIEYFGREGTDLRVHITALGVDFLSYIKGQYPTTYKFRAF